MSYEFRDPRVSGARLEEQVSQILSFLRQHVRELNWAFRSVEETAGLSDQQRKELAESLADSPQLFGRLCQTLRRRQEKENFLGTRRPLLTGVSLTAGEGAPADCGAIRRYGVCLLVADGQPVLCGVLGEKVQGGGYRLGLEAGQVVVEEGQGTVTALYGII